MDEVATFAHIPVLKLQLLDTGKKKRIAPDLLKVDLTFRRPDIKY